MIDHEVEALSQGGKNIDKVNKLASNKKNSHNTKLGLENTEEQENLSSSELENQKQ